LHERIVIVDAQVPGPPLNHDIKGNVLIPTRRFSDKELGFTDGTTTSTATIDDCEQLSWMPLFTRRWGESSYSWGGTGGQVVAVPVSRFGRPVSEPPALSRRSEGAEPGTAYCRRQTYRSSTEGESKVAQRRKGAKRATCLGAFASLRDPLAVPSAPSRRREVPLQVRPQVGEIAALARVAQGRPNHRIDEGEANATPVRKQPAS